MFVDTLLLPGSGAEKVRALIIARPLVSSETRTWTRHLALLRGSAGSVAHCGRERCVYVYRFDVCREKLRPVDDQTEGTRDRTRTRGWAE